MWFLPGGMVDQGETLEAAVRREAGEEVGAILNHIELFNVFTEFKGGKSDHVVVYLSQDFSLNGLCDDEIERYEFFDLNALPDDISRSSFKQVQKYQEQSAGSSEQGVVSREQGAGSR